MQMLVVCSTPWKWQNEPEQEEGGNLSKQSRVSLQTNSTCTWALPSIAVNPLWMWALVACMFVQNKMCVLWGLIVLWCCAPGQSTLPIDALSWSRSNWVPGGTGKACVFEYFLCARCGSCAVCSPGSWDSFKNEQILWLGGNCVKSGD